MRRMEFRSDPDRPASPGRHSDEGMSNPTLPGRNAVAGKKNFLPAMHEKGLEVYFRDINRYDLLSREEEVELAQRMPSIRTAKRHVVS